MAIRTPLFGVNLPDDYRHTMHFPAEVQACLIAGDACLYVPNNGSARTVAEMPSFATPLHILATPRYQITLSSASRAMPLFQRIPLDQLPAIIPMTAADFRRLAFTTTELAPFVINGVTYTIATTLADREPQRSAGLMWPRCRPVIAPTIDQLHRWADATGVSRNPVWPFMTTRAKINNVDTWSLIIPPTTGGAAAAPASAAPGQTAAAVLEHVAAPASAAPEQTAAAVLEQTAAAVLEHVAAPASAAAE